jgi:hypothetical protein
VTLEETSFEGYDCVRLEGEAGAVIVTTSDLGAAIQVFVCDDFCELETLGPLKEVAPDGAARHREQWTVQRAGNDG